MSTRQNPDQEITAFRQVLEGLTLVEVSRMPLNHDAQQRHFIAMLDSAGARLVADNVTAAAARLADASDRAAKASGALAVRLYWLNVILAGATIAGSVATVAMLFK